MRALTPEQKAVMASFDWPMPPPTKAEIAAIEEAKVTAAKMRDIQQAHYAEQEKRRAEEVRPLKEALRAAGITLNFHSYEGVWGSYQLLGGPVVEFDQDDFNTEDI